MGLIACGINHKTAPIELREPMSFDATQSQNALLELKNHPFIKEAVLVSTCNRTEIYSETHDIKAVQDWLFCNHPQGAKIAPFCYQHHDIDAVKHLIRVACGLDSMMLGEPQILGQVKDAYQIAQQSGTIGHYLKHLFPSVFSASKAIRSATNIGKCPVSIAYAAIQLAKHIFADIKPCTVLLVGAGTIIELVATHLEGIGVKQLIIANRTIEKANKLANPLHGQAIRIGDIPHYLKECDIVVSATASQLPIIGKGMIESIQKTTKHRPIFMADLAMPRDIEPEIGNLANIYLYNIDDLQTVTNDNLKNRHEAAQQAEAMVELQALNYMRQLRVLDAGDIICRYRNQIETMRNQEITKARQLLAQGKNPDDVLAGMARNLINKVMHHPTVKLREAAYHDQLDMLLYAEELLGL